MKSEIAGFPSGNLLIPPELTLNFMILAKNAIFTHYEFAGFDTQFRNVTSYFRVVLCTEWAFIDWQFLRLEVVFLLAEQNQDP